ncbi:MAG: hypothetical protein ACOYOV_08055, partial [Bacteroidales bacterium]
MNVLIKEVISKSDLVKFLRFPFTLYKDNPYWVPALEIDEKISLSRTKNPAFEFCEARYWLAFMNGKIVGRIAGIINHHANECWNEKRVRFGWIDFIDNEDVAKILLNTVEKWGKENGCNEIHGPLGFMDMDREGMLVFGFDKLGTYATIYNHEYYPIIIEKLGFLKDVDWIQFEYDVPKNLPNELSNMVDLISKRYKIHTLKATKSKQLFKYANQIFDVLNQGYKQLYGFTSLTEKQIALFSKQYMSYIIPDFVSIILNEKDEVVAFGISMPSLSIGVQKAKGRLFPFGWWHIIKSIKNCSLIDMCLISIRPDMQKKGLNAIIFHELITNYIKKGVKKAIVNPILEV